MNTLTSKGKELHIASIGHAVFAATMIGLGILGLGKGNFTPTWGGVPKNMPGREILAYLCAVISLLCGICLFWRRAACFASRVLLIYLVAWLLLFRVYHVFLAPLVVGTWWDCGDTAVMIAGAWVLYSWFSRDHGGLRLNFAAGDKGLRIARVLYGLAMIPFGIAHFVYLKETAVLIPGWLPWHPGWVCFTGGAFIAAGLAVLIGVYAGPAATLSTIQLALFTLIVWVPMIWAGANEFQWTEFVDSCALAAGAWVVADSYRIS